MVLHGWTRSQRKPNDINYVPPRENDTIEYHGAIGIFLLRMQHDLKDNVAIIPCSTTPNVISSYRLFPLHYWSTLCYMLLRSEHVAQSTSEHRVAETEWNKYIMKLEWQTVSTKLYSQFREKTKPKSITLDILFHHSPHYGPSWV